MKVMKTISLGTVVGDDIRTRGRIHEIEKYIVNTGVEYVLDFSDVRFISRSFADELLSFIDVSESKIICSNVSKEISQLLDIVRANRNIPRDRYVEKDVLHLKNFEQMSEFFEAI